MAHFMTVGMKRNHSRSTLNVPGTNCNEVLQQFSVLGKPVIFREPSGFFRLLTFWAWSYGDRRIEAKGDTIFVHHVVIRVGHRRHLDLRQISAWEWGYANMLHESAVCTCSMSGWTGLYSDLVSTCSGTRPWLWRMRSASRWSGDPSSFVGGRSTSSVSVEINGTDLGELGEWRPIGHHASHTASRACNHNALRHLTSYDTFCATSFMLLFGI